MPRKDKWGRPRNEAIRLVIKQLRKRNLSYTEIGEELKISRQLAQYYGSKVIHRLPIDKQNDRNIIK